MHTMTIDNLNLFFSDAAYNNIDETSADVESDVAAIRHGSMSPEQLLNHCLDGADADRRQGWLDYANEIARSVHASDGRAHEPLSLPEAG